MRRKTSDKKPNKTYRNANDHSKPTPHKLYCPHPAVSGNSKRAYCTY